jgi:hypothetical protein
MSKSNGKHFNIDDYNRRTLETKANMRYIENIKVMREKQEEMFQKYGRRKWLRPIGRAIRPSKLWDTVASFPVHLLAMLLSYIFTGYLFVVTGWRESLGRWMMMGGVRHKIEQNGDRREIVVIVGGKEVERVKVVV